MTKSAGPALVELWREFGDRVWFVTVYVREAHPGDRVPQPRTLEDKVLLARSYAERDGIPWPVVVDSVDGALHRALDPRPNAAYLADAGGRVVQRVLWSNDTGAIRSGLEAVVAGRAPDEPEVEHTLVPMLSGMGSMDEILEQAGPVARKDFYGALPPMLPLAKLARAFRPLPPLGRGVAATAVVGLGTLALLGAIGALAAHAIAERRRPPTRWERLRRRWT